MTMYSYNNGIGGPSSSEITGARKFIGSRQVIYVSSVNGSNSGGFGYSRHCPVASIGYALSLASDGAVICAMDGHSETSTSAITSSLNYVTIVGEGTGDSRPSMSWTGAVGGYGLNMSGIGVEINNIRFIPGLSLLSTTTSYLVGAPNMVIKSCQFKFSDLAPVGGFTMVMSSAVPARYVRIENCHFLNDITYATASQYPGILMTGNGASGGTVDIADCTFEAGTIGWCANSNNTSGYAFTLGATGASFLAYSRVTNVSMYGCRGFIGSSGPHLVTSNNGSAGSIVVA